MHDAPQQKHTQTHAARVLGGWALAAVPAIMLAVLLLRPTTNSDLFWQLKLGELTLSQGGPVFLEPFSATHLGEASPTLAWLGQALMAFVYGHFGWSGLRLVDALCWCAGFWTVAAACRKKGASPLVLSAAMILGFVAALPTAMLRPQNFAVLCFGLLLAILRLKLSTRATVAIVIPLLLVWQNLHPSVSMAGGVLGVAAAAGWFVWMRDRTRRPPWAETILAPLAMLCVFLTPDGWSILSTSARNSELSVMIGAGEWLPLWRPVNGNLWVSIAIVAGISARAVSLRWDRVDLQELSVTLALFALTLVFYRFAVFWAVSLVPLLARLDTPASTASANSRPFARLNLSRLGVMAPTIVIAALITAFKPVTFREHLVLAPLEILKDAGVRGTIFADFQFGGMLIHTGFPEWKVAYDGRYYRYSRSEWERFFAIQAGEFRLNDIVATYKPAAFVLDPARNGKLVREINNRPGEWRDIYRDNRVVIFVPRT